MAMGRMYPQSRIIYVCPSEKGRLAEKAIRVESSDIEGGWHSLFAETPKVPEPVAKLLAGAHTIFSFISAPGDVCGRNLAAIAPHAAIFHMTTRQSPAAGHASQWLLDDLKALPAAAEAVRQMLRSISDRGLGSHRPIEGFVSLHPGSGADKKNWPMEKYFDLATQLKAAGLSVRTILGEVELEKWPREQVVKFESVGVVIKPRNYVELFEELVRDAVFVGNDSGPGHLAAMIGAPTISLFGTTDPAVWRPLGPSVVMFQRDPIETLDVAEVLAAVQSLAGAAKSAHSAVTVDDD